MQTFLYGIKLNERFCFLCRLTEVYIMPALPSPELKKSPSSALNSSSSAAAPLCRYGADSLRRFAVLTVS